MPHSEIQAQTSKDIISGIALTIIIIMISVSTPMFSYFSMALPLTMLFYRTKLGRNYAMIITVAAFFGMLFMFDGFPTDILIFIGLIFLGFILAEILELNLSIEKTILYTSICIMIIAIVEMLFYKSITGIDLFNLISANITENNKKAAEVTINIYKEYGFTEDKLAILEEISKKLGYYMVRIMPAKFMNYILFITWLTLLTARPLLKMKQMYVPDFGDLRLWQAPDYLIWGVIGSIALIVAPIPGRILVVVGLYGLILSAMIFFFQGVAIISFFIEKRQLSFRYLFIGSLFIMLIIPEIAFLFLSGLGFVDVWKNFRKINIIENDANI